MPILQKRIALRGRDYESSISADYLMRLNGLYEDWLSCFNQCPVLIIPSDNLNLVSDTAHIDKVVQAVKEKLTGKTEVLI